METFKIKRNSWHYWLMTDIFPISESTIQNSMDFCSYWRGVVFRLFGIVLAFVITNLVFLIVGVAFTSDFGWSLNLFLSWLLGFGLISSFILALFLVFLIVYFSLEVIDYLEENKKEREPGLIRMKYLSWKEKFCPAIEVE